MRDGQKASGAFDEKQLARYYDANTRSFLRYGQGGKLGVLHRAVWGLGVTTRQEAFTFVHGLLAQQVASSPDRPPTLLDLGCGVGATLLDLLERTGGRGIGVTNSRVQLELARRRAASDTDRTTFLLADFCRLRLDTAVDLAYAIESFVLASDPRQLFATLRTCVRPGGRLAICDDFLGEEVQRDTLAPHAQRWLTEFERGWRVGALMKPSEADCLAAEHGFFLTEDRDLSPQLELGRFRDGVIRALVTLGRRLPLGHPRWLALLGGNALQQCLRTDLIQYRFRVWQK